MIENGSGLSRTERASAATIAALLRAAWSSAVMPELVASLPVLAVDGTLQQAPGGRPRGQAHMKGGTLTGVQSVAGYVLDRRGAALGRGDDGEPRRTRAPRSRRWMRSSIGSIAHAHRQGSAMTAASSRPTRSRTRSPALEGYDAYGADPWLRAAVRARRRGVGRGGRRIGLGAYVGSPEAQHHATLANRYTPELSTHDRSGHRIDAVEYHPSYHVLMNRALRRGRAFARLEAAARRLLARARRSSTSGTSSSRAPPARSR